MKPDGLTYVGGKSGREGIDFIPARDLSATEAVAYAAEFGGLDKLLATGIYAKAEGEKKKDAKGAPDAAQGA